MVAALAFFSPASVFGWGSVVMALALGYALWRTGGAKVWRETAEAYKARNEELTAELATLRDRVTTQAAQIGELQHRCDALAALPDLTQVLDLTRTMLERHDQVVGRLVARMTEEVGGLTSAIERVELRWG